MAAACCGKAHMGSCGLPPVAGLVQCDSEIGDRFLVAALAAELLQMSPDRVTAHDTRREGDQQPVHGGEDGFRIDTPERLRCARHVAGNACDHQRAKARNETIEPHAHSLASMQLRNHEIGRAGPRMPNTACAVADARIARFWCIVRGCTTHLQRDASAVSDAGKRTCDSGAPCAARKSGLPLSDWRMRLELADYQEISMRRNLRAGPATVSRMWAAAAAALLVACAAPAAAADDFYAGKQITLIVGAGVGGGYDLQARLTARHLPKHI